MTNRLIELGRRCFLTGLAAAGWLVLTNRAQAQSDPIGVVVRQSGIATVMRSAAPQELKAGDGILRGDRIITGPAARLRIEFDDGSTVSIGPSTDVNLSRFVTADDGSITEGVLDLVRGIMRTVVAPSTARERFEIRTRAAVASVRSTDWIIEAKDSDCAVFVVSGRVTVATTGSVDATVLEQGFGTDVVDGADPTAPKQWGAKRVSRVLDLTNVR